MPLNTLEDLRAGKLAGSRRLKLACGLTEFPREIFDLADTLEILDLSGKCAELKSLQADCAQENILARPLFAKIVSVLSTLMPR